MNEMGLKQKGVVAILVMVALYIVAALLWFTKSEGAWKKAAKAYHKEVERFNREEALIGERAKWNAEYETARSAMPEFVTGKDTDTTWLKAVEALARSNLVQIVQSKIGKELNVDDVKEMPIEVDWEGSLEALVKFLHSLENANNGMFDIGELDFKPSNKPGYLKGRMSITCAYMRKE